MSYYQHQGAVQGGGYGALDDEQRKRRKHFRDAGAPFTGGISQPPSQQPLTTGGGPGSAVPTYDVHVQQPQPLAAPRMGAAVDLGHGPVQQKSVAEQYGFPGSGGDRYQQKAAAMEMDFPDVSKPSGDVSLQKSLGTALDFPDVDKPAATAEPAPTAARVVGSGGLSKMPGHHQFSLPYAHG